LKGHSGEAPFPEGRDIQNPMKRIERDYTVRFNEPRVFVE
jgi:hypothetical protein